MSLAYLQEGSYIAEVEGPYKPVGPCEGVPHNLSFPRSRHLLLVVKPAEGVQAIVQVEVEVGLIVFDDGF